MENKNNCHLMKNKIIIQGNLLHTSSTPAIQGVDAVVSFLGPARS
jgi:hypothetical protein